MKLFSTGSTRLWPQSRNDGVDPGWQGWCSAGGRPTALVKWAALGIFLEHQTLSIAAFLNPVLSLRRLGLNTEEPSLP